MGVALLSAVAGCSQRNDVIGTVSSGPDVSFLYDGGTPACDVVASLEGLDLTPSWITVARDCELPASWLTGPVNLFGGDGGMEAVADPLAEEPRPLEPGWGADQSLLLYLLWNRIQIFSDGETPHCEDPDRWYVDFEREPEVVVLCPERCQGTREYVARAIDSGCERLND